MLMHVFASTRQCASRAIRFACALLSSDGNTRIQFLRVTFSSTEIATSSLMTCIDDFLTQDIETTLVSGQTQHDKICIQTMNNVTKSQ